VLLALACAGVAAAVVAAHARDAHPGADLSLADGVRRLRAAVVGDVREPGDAAAPVDDAPSRRAARGTAAIVQHATRGTADAGAQPSGIPWWADTAHWGPGVVFWNEQTRPTLVADAGDTIALPVPTLPDALPDSLRARGVHWAAGGAVTLLGGGRAVLDAPGAAEITAVTAAGRTHTPLVVRPVLRGRVYGGTDGEGVAARVIVRRGAAVDTAWAGADGRFRLPLAPDADGAAEVRVEPAAPAHAPVVLRDVPAARLHALGIVLLPTRWTVAAGDFAGATVAVRAADARGFWQFTRSPARPVGWLRDGPHTVALAPEFDPADTATFWRAAGELGAAWGRPLYVPAAPGDSADVVVREAPSLSADGFTSLGWDGTGAISAATIDFRVPRPGALQARVVAHELLHTLGFGHARGWYSVLAPAGRSLAAGPTAADVAYGQLYEALRRDVRRAEAAYGAAYGWGDAAP